MISVFNLEELRDLLENFYRLANIRITIFDENLHELISYPAKIAPCCQIIRRSEIGDDACIACDQKACAIATQRRRTCIYQCHAGLTEAITPLYVGDVPVGYVFFGHVFSYEDHDTGWAEISRRCAHFPLNMEELKDAIYQMTPFDTTYIQSAAQIMHAVASYLIMEQMATLREDEIAVKLDSYVSAHFTEHLRSQDLCEVLGIGKTHLYKLSMQLYNCGIAKHIRELRIEKAKDMLRSQKDIPLSEVAGECGYNDYNYFIASFHQATRLSPSAWKQQHTK